MESKTYENILIIDTEGTYELREIGAILWNLRTNETIEFSSHVPHSVAKIDEFKNLIAKCDGIIGHCITHDKLMLNKTSVNISDKILICSFRNFKWPNNITSFRLKDICEHFNIEPVDIHTAITDCRLLRQCLMYVPNYSSIIQNTFHEKGKRKIQLIYTKLVEFKNGQTILTQFLNSISGLHKHERNHDNGVIIPCPTTIEINSTRKITMENVEKLKYYITNNYPILVKRVRIHRHPSMLFIIGIKPNTIETDEIEHSAIPKSVFKKTGQKRKRPWKTVQIISPGTQIAMCKQGSNVIAQFRWRSGGIFHKCRRDNTNYKIVSPVQFPEMLEIVDDATIIKNLEKMMTYIPNHPIRVDRFQDSRNNCGLLFNIGEPISKPHDIKYVESKSESFRILNQTDFGDEIFLKYVEEHEFILTSLQQKILRFAPMRVNETNFILSWNFTTNTLEIVPDS